MKKVYPFTNENISSYKQLYNFDNVKVLTVLGSGDQYFSSLLYGAKEIEVYDCNYYAWDFFILKYYGILILNYDEFYDFFVIKQLNDLTYLKKLLAYLPNYTTNRLITLLSKYRKLSEWLHPDIIDNKYNNGSVIPYFNKGEYYKLKSILQNQKLPIFYSTYLQALPKILSKQYYDIILTSNIFDWLYADLEEECVKDYKDLLNKFNYGEIQALYRWSLSVPLKQELEKNDFNIEYVPSTKTLSLSNDAVVSLRNK